MNSFRLSQLSIRQRLPLLICTLLLSVILIFGVISYLVVKEAALKVGQERLFTLSQQLSSMLSTSSQTQTSAAHVTADKQAVRSFLLSGGKDSAAAVDQLLMEMKKDSSFIQAEFRDPNGVSLAKSSKAGVNIDLPVNYMLAGNNNKGPVTKTGKMHIVGDSLYYPIMATVLAENHLVGYFIKWRKMTRRLRSVEQLTKLMGSDARLLIGNADGSLWTDMRKPVDHLPYTNNHDHQYIEYTSADKGQMLASVRPIENSQWVVCIAFPKSKILDAANRSLVWFLIIGSIVLIVGIFIACMMSRNITLPLKHLTSAASNIADGDYTAVVQVNRHDETGKLARAFNAMVVQVKESQQALEKRAANYQLLFQNNPMPMWIMCRASLKILDVNTAAVDHYGYSRDEFLQLSAKDLRPASEVEKFVRSAFSPPLLRRPGVWKHKTKDGRIILVDVIAENIVYQEKEARIILAHDITEKIKAESELIEHRIRQKEMIAKISIQAQETEREELGKELHDNINQLLASSKLYMELARSGNRDSIDWALKKSYENLNLATTEIRQLSKRLVPPALDNTLLETIADLTNEIRQATPIHISVTADSFDESKINEDLKLVLYRIVQEQMNNILKYAKATHVTIFMENNDELITLLVIDDGVGFDTAKKSTGIGLRNIDNRVKFYNGTVNISSQFGKGCQLEIQIPVIKETVTFSY